MLTLLSKIGTLPFLLMYAGRLLLELLSPFAFELIGSKLEASWGHSCPAYTYCWYRRSIMSMQWKLSYVTEGWEDNSFRADDGLELCASSSDTKTSLYLLILPSCRLFSLWCIGASHLHMLWFGCPETPIGSVIPNWDSSSKIKVWLYLILVKSLCLQHEIFDYWLSLEKRGLLKSEDMRNNISDDDLLGLVL